MSAKVYIAVPTAEGGCRLVLTGRKPCRRTSHQVLQDSIEPTMHPADGQIYDSRSVYDSVTRAHGLVDVSGEKDFVTRRPKIDYSDMEADVADAYEHFDQSEEFEGMIKDKQRRAENLWFNEE